MFVFWGDGSQQAMDLVNAIRVRSTENFNWTFIFILAVVFYVYWSEINKPTRAWPCTAFTGFTKSATPSSATLSAIRCGRFPMNRRRLFC